MINVTRFLPDLLKIPNPTSNYGHGFVELGSGRGPRTLPPTVISGNVPLAWCPLLLPPILAKILTHRKS